MYNVFSVEKLNKMAKDLYREERKIDRLDGWFIAKETEMLFEDEYKSMPDELKKHIFCAKW